MGYEGLRSRGESGTRGGWDVGEAGTWEGGTWGGWDVGEPENGGGGATRDG